MTIASTPIALSAPVNLRDLGGIAIEGGALRPGVAIRTDDLATVTESVAEQLVAQGLTAVIDLRSDAEATATGRGPLAAHPVEYHHLPLLADVGRAVAPHERPDLTHEGMGAMYLRMVEDAAPQLVAALEVIAATPGATAFHCAAGRDRTGVLAAMLLLALGATDDDIVTDYARTGDNMPAILERIAPVMAAVWSAMGLTTSAHDTSALLEGSMAVSMRILLASLRERHGDPLAPLRAAGLRDETVQRLRARAIA